MIYKVKLKL